MIPRRLCMALIVAAGVVAAASAQDKNVVQYADLTEPQKAIINAYAAIPKEVNPPSTNIYLQNGEIDHRDARERYLNPGHPGPVPRQDMSTWSQYVGVPNLDGLPTLQSPAQPEQMNLPLIRTPATLQVTYNITPIGIYPKKDPFFFPPGTNLLPTVYQDARDGLDKVMINTLPSTPRDPYHLHDGPSTWRPIDPTSPTDDLQLIIDRVYQTFTGKPLRGLSQSLDRDLYEQGFTGLTKNQELQRKIRENADYLRYHLKWAIDIIEGNPVPGKEYSNEDNPVPGKNFRLLHHSGQNRVKRVKPKFDADGNVSSGEVEVKQLWYDQRIESDTMFFSFDGKHVDPPGSKLPPIPDDVPWTITYKIKVLNRGADDFSTTTMFLDDPQAAKNYFDRQHAATQPLPHIAMDQTFFPMDSGTERIIKIKMPPNKYYNLTYTWGWRIHPPRAQAAENAGKKIPVGGKPANLVDIEKEVFEETFKNPIDAISDLAPAKRMWRSFNDALRVVNSPNPNYVDCLKRILEAQNAYLDWKDRTHLPSGLRPDCKSDLTLFYANNTIYGELTDGGFVDMPKWRERGTDVRVTLINGDYFEHGYLNIDFGGNRGWENQFKSSIAVAGTGSVFSFGRFHWRMNTNPGTITVEKARGFHKDNTEIKPGEMPYVVEPGVHRVWIQLNHDPSRRIRLYQFDPLHHDVAIYSIH